MTDAMTTRLDVRWFNAERYDRVGDALIRELAASDGDATTLTLAELEELDRTRAAPASAVFKHIRATALFADVRNYLTALQVVGLPERPVLFDSHRAWMGLYLTNDFSFQEIGDLLSVLAFLHPERATSELLDEAATLADAKKMTKGLLPFFARLSTNDLVVLLEQGTAFRKAVKRPTVDAITAELRQRHYRSIRAGEALLAVALQHAHLSLLDRATKTYHEGRSAYEEVTDLLEVKKLFRIFTQRQMEWSEPPKRSWEGKLLARLKFLTDGVSETIADRLLAIVDDGGFDPYLRAMAAHALGRFDWSTQDARRRVAVHLMDFIGDIHTRQRTREKDANVLAKIHALASLGALGLAYFEYDGEHYDVLDFLGFYRHHTVHHTLRVAAITAMANIAKRGSPTEEERVNIGASLRDALGDAHPTVRKAAHVQYRNFQELADKHN